LKTEIEFELSWWHGLSQLFIYAWNRLSSALFIGKLSLICFYFMFLSSFIRNIIFNRNMVSMPRDVTKLSKEEISKWVNSFDTVLSDCDGKFCRCFVPTIWLLLNLMIVTRYRNYYYTVQVFITLIYEYSCIIGVLWLENEVIEDSENVLNKFRDLGKKVFFVTNNSTKTREELLAKCHNLGFKADLVSISTHPYFYHHCYQYFRVRQLL